MTLETAGAFCLAVAVAWGAAAGNEEETRAALEDLLSTRYCGTAAMDGMGISTAILGQSPIHGGGFFHVPEEEWRPMLLDMAAEELESRKRDLADAVAETRHWRALGEIRDNSDDEGTHRLWTIHTQLVAGTEKLSSMVVCLRHARGGAREVLDMLERVAKECPPEFDIFTDVNSAIVDKACRDGESGRCADLGRWYRNQFGVGSEQEWNLVCRFARSGLPSLVDETERASGFRYLLEYGDTLGTDESAQYYDDLAAVFVPGWTGSLQRKHLAERVEKQNAETNTMSSHAASELAAKDSELTDLRQVYGDWTKEKAEE
jgi:hypothetical protein